MCVCPGCQDSTVYLYLYLYVYLYLYDLPAKFPASVSSTGGMFLHTQAWQRSPKLLLISAAQACAETCQLPMRLGNHVECKRNTIDRVQRRSSSLVIGVVVLVVLG